MTFFINLLCLMVTYLKTILHSEHFKKWQVLIKQKLAMNLLISPGRYLASLASQGSAGRHRKDRHIVDGFHLLKMFPGVTLAVQDSMPRESTTQ